MFTLPNSCLGDSSDASSLTTWLREPLRLGLLTTALADDVVALIVLSVAAVWIGLEAILGLRLLEGVRRFPAWCPRSIPSPSMEAGSFLRHLSWPSGHFSDLPLLQDVGGPCLRSAPAHLSVVESLAAVAVLGILTLPLSAVVALIGQNLRADMGTVSRSTRTTKKPCHGGHFLGVS